MMARPKAPEAAPYYFRYIDQVKTDDVLADMEDQLCQASELFSLISEKKSQSRYASDKWSIREVLNHVNDAERLFAFRAWWFARGFEAPLPSFDQNVAAASAPADATEWQFHVEEFHSVRRATITLFRNLSREAWDRGGVASDNRFTVQALAFIIAGHFTHHVTIIRERYLR